MNAISDVRRLRVRARSFRCEHTVSDEALHFWMRPRNLRCERAVLDVGLRACALDAQIEGGRNFGWWCDVVAPMGNCALKQSSNTKQIAFC